MAKNWFGRVRATPYTIFPDERPLSSLGTAHKPSSTHGRWAVQSEPNSLALKPLFVGGEAAPPSRWLVDGRQLWRCAEYQACCRERTIPLKETVPHSPTYESSSGIPNCTIQSLTSAAVHLMAEVEKRGTTSAHLIEESTMVTSVRTLP